MIEILAIGAAATVQDLGRTGRAALGVPRSGAFDRRAASAANRLVGNPPGAALLEVTLGGLAVQLLDAATVALTGAPCPADVDHGVAVSLPAGAALHLGMPRTGLRTYLAVRGGVEVPAVLGSRATDTLSGLGPRPLRPGDRLAVGRATGGPVGSHPAVLPPPRRTLRIVPGPRDDWFAAAALDLLTSATWTVRPESDRIGLRLSGPALARTVAAELASEPMLPGALQVPPDGRPILVGPDGPVTGGYPVIAVVVDADVDDAGQLRPGDAVRFSRWRRAGSSTATQRPHPPPESSGSTPR